MMRLGIVFCTLLLLVGYGPVQAADRAGEVVSLLESPEVRTSASATWKSLRVGDAIHVGDRIRTGEGKLKLLLNDDTVLTLDSGTELSIARHMYKPKQKTRTSMLDLWSGRVKALVAGFMGESDITVRSPTAVAGVRGTHFVMEIVPAKTAQACPGGECFPADDGGPDPGLQGATRVFVLDGLVNLSNGKLDMDLAGGLTGLMDGSGILEQARDIAPGEMVALKTSMNFRARQKALQAGADATDKPKPSDNLDDVDVDMKFDPPEGSKASVDPFLGDTGAKPQFDIPPANQQSFEPGMRGGTILRIQVPRGVR